MLRASKARPGSPKAGEAQKVALAIPAFSTARDISNHPKSTAEALEWLSHRHASCGRPVSRAPTAMSERLFWKDPSLSSASSKSRSLHNARTPASSAHLSLHGPITSTRLAECCSRNHPLNFGGNRCDVTFLAFSSCKDGHQPGVTVFAYPSALRPSARFWAERPSLKTSA